MKQKPWRVDVRSLYSVIRDLILFALQFFNTDIPNMRINYKSLSLARAEHFRISTGLCRKIEHKH